MRALPSSLGVLGLCYRLVFVPPTASCADLVAAAEATSRGDILGQMTQEFVTCDDWTTIEVKENKFKLVGELSRYTLKRVRFAVASGSVLRVEVPGPIEFAASFQGDDSQVPIYQCSVSVLIDAKTLSFPARSGNMSAPFRSICTASV